MYRDVLQRWLPAVLLVAFSAVPAGADTRGVKVDGKAPADYVAEQIGQSWAVVIGIDEYQKVPRLKYAVSDAKSMAEMLRHRGYQVTEIYNERATRGNILGELGDKLVERVGEHDRVVIFYAGHGETKKAKGGKEMGYLLPVNGERDALAETGISMGLIRELSDALPSKHILFLVDVCYGGIAGQQFRSLPKMTEDYLRAITRERGRQLITAGGANQEAMEGPEWGHSVFTYYLLEGLNKGLADQNGDGIIPASELYGYLDSRVFSAAQMKGHRQRPELWAMAADKGEFVFFTMPRAKPDSPAPASAAGGPSPDMAKLMEKIQELEKRVSQPKPDEPKPLDVAKAPAYQAPPVDLPKETTGKDGAPMALVPAGEFLMGNNVEADSPEHRVYLDAFYMDKFEVTNARYAKFLENTKRNPPFYWEEIKLPGEGDRPVIGVDWHDAGAYCAWAGKRLPTEAEWEKAARGTDGRRYAWGNDEPSSLLANYNWDGKRTWQGLSTISPVGSYEAGKSPYGIYDLTGNLWEWVADWYDATYYRLSPEKNPPGPAKGTMKSLRGGAWLTLGQRSPVSRRNYEPSMNRQLYLGFRCVQSVKP